MEKKPDCLNCKHYKDILCKGDTDCECPRCQLMNKEEKKNETDN